MTRDASGPVPAAARLPVGYLALVTALCVFVGLLTANRDEVRDADAWEHHRAVLALTEDLRAPGNPTFLAEEPSIRYSPYTLLLAMACRWTGVDAYRALSVAAVVNTALFGLGLLAFLRRFQATAAAGWILFATLMVYGETPGYAGSLALADLPWHQVNPSAFALGACLFAWGWFVDAVRGQGQARYFLLGLPLLAAATLSHGMNGAFSLVVLLAVALVVPVGSRLRGVGLAMGSAVILAGLCAAWPLYDFVRATLAQPDRDFWFNPWILGRVLGRWYLPALLLAALAVPSRSSPLVRLALVLGLSGYGLGILSALVASPTLARMPILASLFLHVCIGVYLHQSGLLRPAGVVSRLREAWGAAPGATRAVLELILVATLALLTGVQCQQVLSAPHLARPLVAGLLGRPDKQLHVWDRYQALLAGIPRGQVVIADRETGWPVPSFGLRIVSAQHYEFFVADQPKRDRDVLTCLAPETDRLTRIGLLARYRVDWILLRRGRQPEAVIASFAVPGALRRQAGDLLLVDAKQWLALQ